MNFIDRCELLMTHAWMVRTFIKHCEEVEEFPELMVVARSIFDLGRALETRTGDQDAYLKMLRKKLPKLRQAVEHFEREAPQASTHMNFIMAAKSIRGVYEDLNLLAAQATIATTSRSETEPDTMEAHDDDDDTD
ncbi:MAG: amidohydrolase [Planctomycetaceae bacterium]